jgi:hypothetical protein
MTDKLQVTVDPSLKPDQVYLIDTRNLYWKPPRITLWDRIKCRLFGIHQVGWTGLTCLVCGKKMVLWKDGRAVRNEGA